MSNDKNDKNECKIKILKNGPYIVTGNVPLTEKTIVSESKENVYREERKFPQIEEYALCRCGKSKNPPFCDGSHEKAGFDGTENASRDKFKDRAYIIEGPDLDLMDDESLCAFARFCHKDEGNVWKLTENSDEPENRKAAIEAACDCPAGRLVAMDKMGNTIEPDFEPSIEIL